ncbi:type II 3-dehydroquinate dehydratase [Aerococcaceae bacterium WGS1372]
MKKILMLHGVNHNLFGQRNPQQYGQITLDAINQSIQELANALNIEVESFQTNHEGEMVEKIHQAFQDKVDAIAINAGAWTHYSYAIRDALEIIEVPIIEVHMSNIHAREPFRQVSVFTDIVSGQISGLGLNSYLLAIRALSDLIH